MGVYNIDIWCCVSTTVLKVMIKQTKMKKNLIAIFGNGKIAFF